MENKTTAVRRPVGLWILVGLYSTLILISYATQVYMRFRSPYSSTLAAKYEGWTLLDYVVMYYPGILILLGCLGLVMLGVLLCTAPVEKRNTPQRCLLATRVSFGLRAQHRE